MLAGHGAAQRDRRVEEILERRLSRDAGRRVTRRDSYSLDMRAREVLAVVADDGIAAPPVVAGTA